MPTKSDTPLKLYLPGSFTDGSAQRALEQEPHPMLANFQLLMRVQLPLWDAGVFLAEYEHRTREREQIVLAGPGDFI